MDGEWPVTVVAWVNPKPVDVGFVVHKVVWVLSKYFIFLC